MPIMTFEIPIGGFIVGLLIGLTGMGGGLVMTPLMIFVFGINPTLAVATDLVYASITKLFGAWQHWRQRTIDWTIVKLLTIGSVPGALFGVFTLLLLQQQFASIVEGIIGKLLGLTYLLIACLMIYQIRRNPFVSNLSVDKITPPGRKLILIGIVAGYIVGLTSVGSGTLFMALLIMIYPMVGARIVGTDIAQAVIVTGVAGLIHFVAGNVDLKMVGLLLIGSIPGILIGSKLTMKLPDLAVRGCLFIMIFLSGFKLLMK